MGHAGVVNVGGLRIAGLSGIFKENHYRLGHHEVPIFSDDAMRSFYHVRELDVFRLMQLRDEVERSSSCPHGRPTSISNTSYAPACSLSKVSCPDAVSVTSVPSPLRISARSSRMSASSSHSST